MSRRFFVGGNWKCNPTTKQAVSDLVKGLNDAKTTSGAEVVVATPSVYLDHVHQQLRKDYSVAAQNIYTEPKGAFTGEVSTEMLKDLGIRWTLVGHSERRALFNETDAVVAKKTARALETGLGVIGCLGETLAEFDAGHTEQVVSRQLKAYADVLKDWTHFVIAYEPVWAIGTGKTATPERAQEVHAFLRKWLAANVSAEVAATTRILYGGSVTAANCDALAKQADVDGFLVGGASLKAADFAAIINSGSHKTHL